jgi:hypothetical protein
MTPQERWQVGLAVLTAYVGPENRRAADITAVAGELDPREVLFGVLAVARDLLVLVASNHDTSMADVLQALAEHDAGPAGSEAASAGPSEVGGEGPSEAAGEGGNE